MLECKPIIKKINIIPKLDLSKLLKNKDKEEVINLKSLKEFIHRLREIRQKAYNTKICISNDVTFATPMQFICNLSLSIILYNYNILI